jgi:putative FmdB family regulatory protein
MPVYAYRCQSCGVQFERQQRFDEKPLTRCPECRKGTVRRILQPPAIVFKGSGWYATDHRSPSGQSSFHKGEKTESEHKKAETAATTEKTESKKAEATTASTTSASAKAESTNKD